MTATDVTIRPLQASDRDAWGALWRDYLAFYRTELPQAQYDLHFARLLGDDPQDFHGRLAEIGGRAVGLVHYLFHRHGWRPGNVCYLQDLYARPEMRGRGVGRALIETVYAEADAAGAPDVYWLTQAGNETARRLYDRLALATDFIKYQRPA